ncbi:MAG: hypothetical protein JW748_13850 [Anaerolineales bacterium]|nr:hypothetical protein [Anaerolineales bacterium]
MGSIERTTRTSSIRQLNPKLQKGLQDYFQANNLGALDSQALLVCETVTERAGFGRLAAWLDGSPDSTEVLGLVLTPQYLLWARAGDRTDTVVVGADLKQIRVRKYASRFPQEAGLEISGFVGPNADRVRGKLALGPEEAAQQFIDEVIRAVKQAKPPRKSIFPWLNK